MPEMRELDLDSGLRDVAFVDILRAVLDLSGFKVKSCHDYDVHGNWQEMIYLVAPNGASVRLQRGFENG